MDYWRPDSLQEALELLTQKPRIVAGCTDLFPATDRPDLAMGQNRPLLDITAISSLRGIERNEAGLRIGATTSWSDILAADLPTACDGLKQAARQVGAVQIQNSGTIAGNLCNASPAADGVPPLLTLDAEIELRSARGQRVLPLASFIKGPRQTMLEADELVSAILVPAHTLAGKAGFQKLGARHYLVISIAMLAMRLEFKQGRISNAAVAMGACSPVARRLARVEDAICHGRPIEPADLRDQLDPISDVRADARYRLDAACILINRMVERLTSAQAIAA